MIERYALMVAAVAAGVFAALAAVFRSGQKAERGKQDANARKALETRNQADDELRKTSPDQRRDALGRWVRNDG
jgi:hypothetical protein